MSRLFFVIGVVLFVVSIVAAVVLGIMSIGVRLSNPAMTETQLFLYYWPVSGILAAALFIGVCLVNATMDKVK